METLDLSMQEKGAVKDVFGEVGKSQNLKVLKRCLYFIVYGATEGF